jgi:sugar phosphate isomerase/epimerase
MSASDFAHRIGVKNIVTHVGFIPENPSDPDFNGTVAALKHLCGYMKQKEQFFLFETGQETPITLLRTIEAIGTRNVGINLDTANPILYGKANPLDALDVFGKYVMDTHIKDGFYPTNGMYLGHESRAGDGKANIPAVVKKLITEYGYQGPFTIEREISGEQQLNDIIHAKRLLEGAMQSATRAKGE